jgi:opacity protein-like surface antigen
MTISSLRLPFARAVLLCSLAFGLCACLPAGAQQEYVPRYDLFTGYSHLTSPSVSLQQNGFNGSFGGNLLRWLAVGADFSVFQGNGSIELAKTNVAPLLAPHLGGRNPSIPFSATTDTFAAGPQFEFRKYKWFTLFARPGLGALHESASLQIPPALAPLAPLVPGLAPNLTNTVVFYGVGGGLDYNLSRHVAVRFSADFVHTHLFANLLEPRNAVRISVGPTWRWGELK